MTLILDGGNATELQRHGVLMAEPWLTSASLLDDAGLTLQQTIHADYIAAGADVVTANTFRTNRRFLRRVGVDDERGAHLVRAAVDAAVRARAEQAAPVRVAGSMPPAEDCYRPDLTPPAAELVEEHTWLAGHLAAAGADLVLVETHNCVREAVIATRCARRAGLPVWASFTCGSGGRLLSGEPLEAAVEAVEEAGAETTLVNCTALADIEECLRRLRAAATRAIGLYPNNEDRSEVAMTHVEHRLESLTTPERFAGTITRWTERYGLDVVGGCCGTTPDHIAALRSALLKGAPRT